MHTAVHAAGLEAVALLILRCMAVTALPMRAGYVTPGTYLPQHPPAAAAAVTYSQSSAMLTQVNFLQSEARPPCDCVMAAVKAAMALHVTFKMG